LVFFRSDYPQTLTDEFLLLAKYEQAERLSAKCGEDGGICN
jgi:hypothetical protein